MAKQRNAGATGKPPNVTFRIGDWTLSSTANGFLKLLGPVDQIAHELHDKRRRAGASERSLLAAFREALEAGSTPEAAVAAFRRAVGLRKMSSRETQRRKVADYIALKAIARAESQLELQARLLGQLRDRSVNVMNFNFDPETARQIAEMFLARQSRPALTLVRNPETEPHA